MFDVQSHANAVEAEPENRVETPAPEPQPLVEADILIEDVSIDGMCGVS
jgi:mycofactocin precursor